MDLTGLGGSVEELMLSPGFSPKHQKNGRTEEGKEGRKEEGETREWKTGTKEKEQAEVSLLSEG